MGILGSIGVAIAKAADRSASATQQALQDVCYDEVANYEWIPLVGPSIAASRLHGDANRVTLADLPAGTTMTADGYFKLPITSSLTMEGTRIQMLVSPSPCTSNVEQTSPPTTMSNATYAVVSNGMSELSISFAVLSTAFQLAGTALFTVGTAQYFSAKRSQSGRRAQSAPLIPMVLPLFGQNQLGLQLHVGL
jgi:hypothetical protein